MYLGNSQMYSQALRKWKGKHYVEVFSYLLMLQSLSSCYTFSRIIPKTGKYHGGKNQHKKASTNVMLDC